MVLDKKLWISKFLLTLKFDIRRIIHNNKITGKDLDGKNCLVFRILRFFKKFNWKFILDNIYSTVNCLLHYACIFDLHKKHAKMFWRKNLVTLTGVCTVGKIYTPIISFFWKRVVNIVIWELGLVSNERSGNFTFYRDFHEFLNSFIFETITVIKNYIL